MQDGSFVKRWSSSERWPSALLLLAMATLAVILSAHPRRSIDLQVYLTAGSRFLEGSELYRATDGAMPFKYAPQTASMFAALSWLPVRLAAVLWSLLTVAGMAWVFRVARRELAAPRLLARWELALLAAALAHPLYLELHYGQVDVAIGVLLVWSFLLRERPGWRAGLGAGALIAVAALLKAPSGIVLLLPLYWRDLRVLAGFAGGGVLLTVPLAVRYGLSGMVTQLREWSALVESSTAPWILGHNPQGLPTLFLAMSGAEGAPSGREMMFAQGGAFVVLAAVLLSAAWGRGEQRSSRFGLYSAAIAATALASPLGWRANFCLLLPLLVRILASGTRPGVVAVGALVLVGVSINPWLWGRERFMDLMMWRPFTAAGILLLAVWWWSARRRAIR